MSLSETVTRNIRAARAAHGFTQEALARKARVSVSYVSMLERGERIPPLGTLERLAGALGVPPLDLLRPSKARDAAPRRRAGAPRSKGR